MVTVTAYFTTVARNLISSLAKMEVGQRHIYPDEIKLLKEILQVSFDELLNI